MKQLGKYRWNDEKPVILGRGKGARRHVQHPRMWWWIDLPKGKGWLRSGVSGASCILISLIPSSLRC